MSLNPKYVPYVLLDDLGFSLSQLATAIGYSSAALRAFRTGALKDQDPITHEDIRLRLGDIALLVSRLGRHRGKGSGGTDEAALFEIKVIDGYTAIGWDLYRPGDGERCARISRGREGAHSALCELAEGANPATVLDKWVPDWRMRYWTDYETFLDLDGHMSIRRKKAS